MASEAGSHKERSIRQTLFPLGHQSWEPSTDIWEVCLRSYHAGETFWRDHIGTERETKEASSVQPFAVGVCKCKLGTCEGMCFQVYSWLQSLSHSSWCHMEQIQAVPDMPGLHCRSVSKLNVVWSHYILEWWITHPLMAGKKKKIKCSTSDIYVDCFYLKEATGPLWGAGNAQKIHRC